MARVPQALAGYRDSLSEGCGGACSPRRARSARSPASSADWLAASGGAGWFAEFAAGAEVPAALRADLDAAAAGAAAACAGLRDWLTSDYLPRRRAPRTALARSATCAGARRWTGADLDLAEAYDWGWSEYRRIREEMHDEARRVLPGAAPAEAMRYLDEHSPAVDGVEQVRRGSSRCWTTP